MSGAPTIRLVSADAAWLADAAARVAAAGSVVLGAHAPGEPVPPAALSLLDAATVGAADAAAGPTVLVGARPEGAEPILVGPDGCLAHLPCWPSPDALLDTLRPLVLSGLARGPLGRGRLFERALETLLSIETASVEIVDPAVRLLWVNPAFTRVTGRAAEEVVGRTTGELFRAGTHDPAFYRDIMATLRAGRAWTGSMVGQRVDGTLSFQETVLAPVLEGDAPIGFVALKRDLDRDALAARALKGPEDRARTVLDAVADPWFVHDLDGAVIEHNHAAGDVFALASAEARAAGLRAFVLEEDWPALTDAWSALEEGVPGGCDARVRLRTGGLAHVSVRSGLVTLAGSRFVLTAMRDETDRVRLEAELRAAKKAAEAAAAARASFLANMSHEIRTPMNAILGLGQLTLAMQDLPPRARDYLEKAQGAAQALLGILDDVLDHSKIEADRVRLERVEFSIDELLDGVCVLLAQRSEAKGLELLVHTSGDVPARVVGDPLRLRQVLTNLAGNAVKFTERGEVEIRVSRRPAPAEQVVLAFEVRDTGIGMSPAQAAQLFTPFVQAEESTSRRFGGTGLGLSISKRLVELMGGRVEVDSAPGRGSVFSFTAALEPVAGASPSVPPKGLDGARILVADDHPAARAVIVEHLARMPVEVVEAEDGVEAVEAVRRAEAAGAPFDLVLMDWRMPRLDGLGALRRIRGELSLARPPTVVFVSGHTQAELGDRAAAEGAAGVLTKPLTRSTLVDSLMQVLGPGARRRRASAEHAAVLDLSGVRVLLVEDVEVNQLIATGLLEAAGARVDVAGNGAEALARLATEDPSARYHVVLMDVQMPVMDGIEATRRIRATPAFATRPVIAMTAHAMLEERARCLEVGMDDHLGKPVDRARLLSTVKRWARQGRSSIVPAPPTAPPPAEGVPSLAWTEALDRVEGNTSLYRRILQMFVADSGTTVARLSLALDAGDEATALHAAHALSGSAATVGALRVADLARRIQVALRVGGQDAAALATLLVDEHHEALVAASAYLRG